MTDLTAVINELRAEAAQLMKAATTLAELNGSIASVHAPVAHTTARKPKFFSPATRAKMAAAQKARWQKLHAAHRLEKVKRLRRNLKLISKKGT